MDQSESYRIEITEPAEQDIRAAYEWWSRNRSREQAQRWYENIHRAIETLAVMPLRCPVAPEYDLHPTGLRQLSFGIGRRPTHRIVFTVEGETVTIIRVRHAAQRDLEANDLP